MMGGGGAETGTGGKGSDKLWFAAMQGWIAMPFLLLASLGSTGHRT